MRVLGVNGASDTLWLACADEDGLVGIPTFQVRLPKALESGEALIAARDEIRRVLREVKVDRVVLLSAGSDGRHKLGYHAVVSRITMEAAVAFAAAEESIDFVRVSRPTAKAWLGLPAAGGIESHVDVIITDPQTPHWRKKRDLAAMAAIAGVMKASSTGSGDSAGE